MTRNYQKIKFPTIAPNSTSLQWHCNMSVIENMGARFLDERGGVKRVPWRKTPIPAGINDEENKAPSGSKMSEPLAPDHTATGAGLPNAPGQQAPNYSSVYSNHSQNSHRTMSDLSPDVDMGLETEFSSSLYELLEMEAWRQEQQEKLEAWRQEQREKLEASWLSQ